MKRRTILQAGLGLAFGGPVMAAVQDDKLQVAADVLQRASDSGQVEAAALYVRQAEREFVRSFGAADSKDAIFLLASISKPITIAAVMTLFEAGEFGLEDPVQKFIPEFRGDGRERITMRQLFTHNSGLPDQLPENSKLRAAHAPLSEFVERAIRTPLLFSPGSKFGYSSMAILLASEVARRISHRPIATLVDEAVCQPLQLKHSALGVGRLNPETLMRCQVENAAPESGSGDPETKSWDWNSDYWRRLGVPWGGAHGSAGDVAKFLNAFLHPQAGFLKRETAQLMIRNHNPPGMRPRGLGFDLGRGLSGPQDSDQVFGHTGSTGTLCWADPASDSICVILTTLPGRAVDPHPRHVASKLVSEAG
ncbi:MAG: serine hydrolase domain-containing protein [Fuerstiella sp.]